MSPRVVVKATASFTYAGEVEWTWLPRLGEKRLMSWLRAFLCHGVITPACLLWPREVGVH